MSPSATFAGELVARLRETPIRPSEIASLLDGAGHAERVTAIRTLGRREQRALYQAVDGFAPLRLLDLVPAATGALVPVRHQGKNTLPAFTHFEKRFCRPRGGDAQKPDELYGYNFQPAALLRPLTGPGYFLAVEDPQRAEVLIDYNRVPGGELPVDWPPVRSNEAGLARFVYGYMIDTLRRVSQHVSVGSAARRGRDMGSWFVLCRES